MDPAAILLSCLIGYLIGNFSPAFLVGKTMGYDVEPTSVMDAKTIEVLKALQAEAGACPYGGLDYCTLGIVKDKFDAWCSPASEDAALAKAVELLK